MKYFTEQKYDKNTCDDYIGIVFRTIPKEKGLYEVDDSEPAYYLKCGPDSGKGASEVNFSVSYKILPILNQHVKDNLQRSVMVIFGASGSGKSVLTNQVCEIYHLLNPRQKIYFISNNNVYRDTSLNHGIYTFIKADDLLEKYSDPEIFKDFKTNNDFDNSLMVFDDIDFSESKESKKLFFGFLNIILKFKRKNLINVIFTTHDVSDYSYTRTLLSELNQYVFFAGDLKNRSNRVLQTYLKLRPKEIERMTEQSSSRWICINSTKRTVLSEDQIYSLV